jgi:hypothetical protein
MANATQLIQVVKDADDVTYYLTNTDNANDPKYYGLLGAGGSWKIIKESGGNLEYALGRSDYDAAWVGRAGLTYT